MKKLLIFSMISASVVFFGYSSVRAQSPLSESYNSDTIEEFEESEQDLFLDTIAVQVRDIPIVQKKITYYDYIRTALYVGYMWCIYKPFNACKNYIGNYTFYHR